MRQQLIKCLTRSGELSRSLDMCSIKAKSLPFFFFLAQMLFCSGQSKDMWDSRGAEYAGQCHFVETTW